MTAASMASTMLPDPFDLMGEAGRALLGPVTGPLADAALDQLGKAVGWLVESILHGMVEVSLAVLGFFWDAAEPDPSASWFSGGRDTPYGQMVVLAAPLLLMFFLAGVIQGALKGDVAGMLQMAVLRLPSAVLAMSVTVAITDLLLRVTNDMSEAVLGGFRDDVEAAVQMLGQVTVAAGTASNSQVLVAVFGLVGLLAAGVLLIELFVRGALIYIVLALCPLIYAASVWESLRGTVRKLAELGLALILSKFAIAVALALSATAMNASWDGGQATTELATPEQAAAAAEASVSGQIGILVSAIVMFGVAAFMPFVLFRLLPMAEGALVAQGIKSGPLRGAQQAHHTVLMARHNPATALSRGRAGAGMKAAAPTGAGAGGAGAGGGTATGGGGGAGGGGAAGASAAAGLATAVVGAGVTVAKKGAARVRGSAETMAGSSSGSGGGDDGQPPGGAGTGARRPARSARMAAPVSRRPAGETGARGE